MNPSNLSRDTARHRSASITLDTIEAWLDITQAQDANQPLFGSRSTLTFASAVETIGIDFLDGEVDEVLVNGESQPVQYDGATVTVGGLRTDGSTNEVTINGRGRYSRSGQGLHRFTDPADGQTYLYTQYEPTDSRRVYAQFDQPDLKAHHIFHVTAPEGWLVLSNQPEIGAEAAPGGVRHDFAPTPKLSTYITAIIAGPYSQVENSWTSADGSLTVPLGLACRASRMETMDAEELFRLTRAGLDFYHEHFGFPYPWGKYDQVFVPEYNLGAMENPGCVTFTEDYLFRSAATRAQYAGRSNTLQHEMAHMWFGDLVTPRWWDELWLKESFAEFMGAHVNEQAAGFPESWVGFAGRRKAWAYAQDELPTTHPVAADIPDVEAAKQNFDGITYAKGASVLKQLVHHVGVDAFFAGSRQYFQDYAWGSTQFADLVRALENSSGRDLSCWTHAWLETSGPDTLRTSLVVGEDGVVTEARLEQESNDRLTGEHVGRPHTLALGLYTLEGNRPVRREQLRVELDGRGADLPELVGKPAPDLVLVNDEDWTYAKVVMDERSAATAVEHLSKIEDPLARALLWSQLWMMVRDGQLRVADYVRAVEQHGGAETDAATLTSLFANAHAAIETWLPEAARPAAREAHLAELSRLLDAAEAGTDTQLIVARALAEQAAVVPSAADRVRGLLDAQPEGLELGPDLRWLLLQALAATGELEQAGLDEALAADDTMDGRLEHLSARAGLPDAAAKAEVLEAALTPGNYSNAQMDAALRGLQQPLSRELLADSDAAHLSRLTQIWQDHSIEMAQRLVTGLFPGASAEVVEQAKGWLEEHADAPKALRRLVLEALDRSERALRLQEFNA